MRQTVLIFLFFFNSSDNIFQTAAVVGDQQSAEDRAEGIFNKMDVNSDGKVTRYINYIECGWSGLSTKIFCTQLKFRQISFPIISYHITSLYFVEGKSLFKPASKIRRWLTCSPPLPEHSNHHNSSNQSQNICTPRSLKPCANRLSWNTFKFLVCKILFFRSTIKV